MDLHDDYAVHDYEEDRTVSMFQTCCGIGSRTRCGLEACQRSLSDTNLNSQLDDAQNGYEYGARGYSRGRGHYFGVGPGVELPTRMHYFQGALNHDYVANANPGGRLRRVPVVNLGLLLSNSFGNGYPTGMGTSELEQYLFDTAPHPRTENTARQPSNYEKFRAAVMSQTRSAKAAVCACNSILSEQAPACLQLEPSVNHCLHQGQTCLLENSPTYEARALNSAYTQQGGPVQAEHGTAEKNPQGPEAGSECAYEADEGGEEAIQDDDRSTSSNSSDWSIVLCP